MTNRLFRLKVRTVAAIGATWALRSSLRPGYVVPAFIAWRPHPPTCKPPSHFPATPVIEAVFGIQESSCLASRSSGLSPLYSPGLPPSASAGSPARAPQFFRTGTGHRVEGRNPWQLQYTHKSASCGADFGGLSVRFRYGPPGCSPPGLTRPAELNVSPAYQGFYFRASSHRVTPITAGYNYGAKLRIAPAGLSPASTAASLAALPPPALPGFLSNTGLSAIP